MTDAHVGFEFQMLVGEESVGICDVEIHKNKVSARGNDQIYPDSWFIDNQSDQLKPVLELSGYFLYGENHGAGYGRAGLQKIYELSLEHGCEGRVEVPATSNATFYEHCGFKGEDKGENGTKCFTPSAESLKSLYKNGKDNSMILQKVEFDNSRYSFFDLDAVGGFKPDFENGAPALGNNGPDDKYVLKQGKKPEKRFNPAVGEFDTYVDENLQKIRALRKKIKEENKDPLLDKQSRILYSFEENGLSKDDIGKTGDSKTGEVSNKHKNNAERHIWATSLVRTDRSQ